MKVVNALVGRLKARLAFGSTASGTVFEVERVLDPNEGSLQS